MEEQATTTKPETIVPTDLVLPDKPKLGATAIAL
jgi:hypothetical protein